MATKRGIDQVDTKKVEQPIKNRIKTTAQYDDSNRPQNHEIVGDVLRIYYDRLFPCSQFFKWLSLGDVTGRTIKHREFSFTLKNDIYIRYCSFSSKEEFKNGLVTKLPYKIDVGAIFNAEPKLKASVSRFVPEKKELVFDIDMTDYDDVRSCCDGAAICELCWPLMTAAVKVLDTALRNDFGFQHLLWVYSGRRGIHCWVCDPLALKLDNDGRKAVVDYLSIETKEGKPMLSTPLHPSLIRAYKTLLPYFEDCCISNQGVLEDSTSVEKIMNLIEPEIRDQFTFSSADLSGMERWEELQANVKSFLRKQRNTNSQYRNSISTLLQRIVFQYLYPRLDANVTRQKNHLLKSPFTIHPKTGRVCVPMDAKNADDFDPFSVPTLDMLHDELNEAMTEQMQISEDPNSPSRKRVSGMDTSLAPYLRRFAAFVQPLHMLGQKASLKAGRGVQTLEF